MKWLKSKTEQGLTKLLKHGSGDFRFDPKNIRHRLMASIEQTKPHPIKHFRLNRVFKFSASFAGFVLIVSATFAFASNQVPGDKLFALNKAGESVILSLPMRAEQRAQVRDYIVDQRFEALDAVNLAPGTKSLETIKESDESFMRAVQEISKNKQKLEAKGKTKQAAKLEVILDNLQKKAADREKIIQKLEDETEDEETKARIHQHLEQIKNSREKARLEIKRFQNPESESDQILF